MCGALGKHDFLSCKRVNISASYPGHSLSMRIASEVKVTHLKQLVAHVIIMNYTPFAVTLKHLCMAVSINMFTVVELI